MDYTLLVVLNATLVTLYYIVNFTEIFEINRAYHLRGTLRNNTLF